MVSEGSGKIQVGGQGRFLSQSEYHLLSSSQELCSACLMKNKIIVCTSNDLICDTIHYSEYRS